MQLVDQGKLDLDRDVNDYIDFAIPTPAGGVVVTLRRLLTHRAGFEEHVKGSYSRDREPEPLGHWLAQNLPRRLFPNGDVEAYSNYGVALAGYIVERISGESYANYIQQHILDPLGMRHSTFQQPLPDDLAPLMAKPPLAFFETVTTTPAGALSTTADDMGRFIRALINGGDLDGVRILSKARLDKMMAPSSSTPAGYLGLVFFGTKIAGHDAIGHGGANMAFSSNLQIFPAQGIGIFASLDGKGETKTARDMEDMIARRFLPSAGDAADAPTAGFPGDAAVAGIFQSSRRAESSLVRLNALPRQLVVKVDSAGQARLLPAIWPFGAGVPLKQVKPHLYEAMLGLRFASVDDGSSESYLAYPAMRLQRVPWTLDVRWIAPAFILSTAVVRLTLLAWPVAALWRHVRQKRWSEDSGALRKYLVVRLVLLADAAVIASIAVLFTMATIDITILNDAFDPLLLVLYAFAWLGVFGAVVAIWAAATFWRNGVGSRWSRIHRSLIAASSVMLAWFFVMFRIAGTTLV
jgi:CubicO group peptidase (beta-lactamase class C family)